MNGSGRGDWGPFAAVTTEVEWGWSEEPWGSVMAYSLDGVMLMGEEPVKPLGRLVRLGFTCCHASTYRLST
jgi:hypothetical protein